MAFFLFSCNGNAQRKTESKPYEIMLKTLLSNSVEAISADSLYAHIEGGKELVILDARPETEFNISRIPGAVRVGYEDYDAKFLPTNLSKDAEIIVYCSVGYRSEKIGEKLKEAGYSNVKNLFGGIFEWKNAGYDVVTETGAITDSVHAFNKKWGIWLNKGVKVY